LRIRTFAEGAILYAICFVIVLLVNLISVSELLGFSLVDCDTSLELELINILMVVATVSTFVWATSLMLSSALTRIRRDIKPSRIYLVSACLFLLPSIYVVYVLEGGLNHACPWFLGKIIIGSILSSLVSYVFVFRNNA